MSGSARSAITTHVLDLATGRPAKGIRVLLRKKEEDSRRWTVIGSGMTNADGRVEALLPADAAISAGTYQLRFDTLSYFEEGPSFSFFFLLPRGRHHVLGDRPGRPLPRSAASLAVRVLHVPGKLRWTRTSTSGST